MTHSIFRRKDRRGFTLSYRDATGRRKMKAFRTRGLAEEEALRLRKNPDTGRDQVLSAYAAEWLKHKAVHLRPSTMRQYRQAMGHHILPELGHLDLTGITRVRVRQFLDGLQLAKKSAWNISQVLHGCLRQAVRDELIHQNPVADHLFLQSKGERAAKVKAFTAEQLRLFLETCREEMPDRYLLFWFMALTGVRLSEGLALQWEDLDVGGGHALIRRGWTEGKTQPTKTGHERTIDVPKDVMDALTARRIDQRAIALQEGKEAGHWVFPSSAGTPVWQYYIRKDFKTLVGKAKLPEHHTPHCLRHSYASLQLSAGESVYYVQRQLGHATITMTTDLYGRWLPAGNPEAAERLARAVSPARRSLSREAK